MSPVQEECNGTSSLIGPHKNVNRSPLAVNFPTRNNCETPMPSPFLPLPPPPGEFYPRSLSSFMINHCGLLAVVQIHARALDPGIPSYIFSCVRPIGRLLPSHSHRAFIRDDRLETEAAHLYDGDGSVTRVVNSRVSADKRDESCPPYLTVINFAAPANCFSSGMQIHRSRFLKKISPLRRR